MNTPHMHIYCFILGTNPIISLAEFFRFTEGQAHTPTIIDITSHAIISSFGQEIPPGDWQQRLGGVVKIARIIDTYGSIDAIHDALTPEYLHQHAWAQTEQKIVFGFSLYGTIAQQHRKKFDAIGMSLKKSLTAEGYAARYVAAAEHALTSVQVTKNSMVDRGAEIVIISGLHGCYLGITKTVQNFEAYSSRDYDRPQRDAVSGMLPPKLAQILINLSGARPNQHILDPFCGSGTIIQESLLMGWQRVTGSDISSRAIADSTENVEWLRQHYPDLPGTATLHTVDVSKLTDVIQINDVEAIVTEPYLGPPVRSEPEVIEMLTIVQELETLYLAAFRSFAQVLRFGGQVAIVFPLFKTRHGIYSLKILETLQAMGFHRINPLPDELSLFAKVGPTARGSLIYQRPGQRVEREIFIFEYKKAEA